MTPGMQVRVWYGAATATERRTTLAAILAASALLVGSLMVRPNDSSSDVAARGAVAATRQAPAATGAGFSAPATSSSPGSASSSSAAGALGTLGAGPTDGTAALAAAPATDVVPVALTASDRGVTESQIKIGVTVLSLAGLDAAGFALNIRGDAPQYAQALADFVNASGGVQGRKVVVAVRKTDPTNTSDQAAACQAMVADEKVFGVIDVGSLTDTPVFDCLATQNQTPFVHNIIWSTDWLARSHGMEVGYPAAIDRIAQTWTRDLASAGWLAGSPTVGVVGDKCIATKPVVDNVLKPALERAGAGKVVIAEHDCDVQSVASQPPSFVTQFRTAGVTKVLFVSSFVPAEVFMKTAQSQLYHPQYSVSDWFGLAQDSAAKNFDPDQFDGAIAITSNGLLLPQSGEAPYDGAAVCSQIAEAAGLPPLEFSPQDVELWGMCDNFLLMVDGIKAAGPNPTRAAWADAVQQLPARSSVVFGPATFGPGKVSGSDQVFTAQWHRACTCYLKSSDFRAPAG